MRPALVVLLAYLLGSIPFGYLIVRFRSGSDIRESGSGGTGATNVSRTAGKGAGVITLLLDALKGAIAVLLAQFLLFGFGSGRFNWWIAITALAALSGHIFPVWLGFRGGKGVATAVGVFLILAPWAIAVAGVIFMLTVFATRYVSLGSILAALSVPLLIVVQNAIAPMENFAPQLFAAAGAACLIIFAHRGNIGRLVTGTENKFR